MHGDQGLTVQHPLIGQVVQSRYRVDRLIGKGAMGIVYEAQHLLLGRKVALKALTASAALSPDRIERFRREAQAAASLGSSHIVDVLDMGQIEGGPPFIVMEHLDGFDLGFAVAAAERLPMARALHILCQLCDALTTVHAAGIVHRDLKPENIFLISRDGEPDFVKVLDFGICKFLDAAEPHLTRTGDALGTPLFMAPEQVEGRRDVDHRTDIYALGALLYFMLTGHAPFDALSLPLLFVQICQEPPPSVRAARGDLSQALDAVIQRALSKRPQDRFESCAALKAALVPLSRQAEALRVTLPEAVSVAPFERSLAGTEDLRRSYLPKRRASKLAVLAFGLLVGGALPALRSMRAKQTTASGAAPRLAAAPFTPAPELSTELPTAAALQQGAPSEVRSAASATPGRIRASEQRKAKPPEPAPVAVTPAGSEPPEVQSPAARPAARSPNSQPPAASPVSAPGSPEPEVSLNREPKRGL
jgi:serine/threonine-protein kinase